MTDFPISDLGPHLAAVDDAVKALMRQGDLPCCSACHMEQNDPRRTMSENILYSPDCRDENHGKCDGVAWDLELDIPSACECDCQCNGKGALNALGVRA